MPPQSLTLPSLCAPPSSSAGQRYEFMIKSWANGTEHRRVFVLEQAADFLRAHGVGVGDAVGICSDEKGARKGEREKRSGSGLLWYRLRCTCWQVECLPVELIRGR